MTAAYNPLNQPTSVSWTPAAAQTTPTTSTVTFTHGYDADNRRISQAANDNSWLGYPVTGPGPSTTTTAYTPNNLNQYTGVGAVTPTYDGNGALTCDGGFTYAYDAESRLTGISALATYGNCSSGTTAAASYAYDAQGRRKSKTVGSTVTQYVTDADNREVLEYDGTTGALQTWNTFGTGPDNVLNQINVAAGTRSTLIPDIQGSIIGQLSSGGTLTKTTYQPFGENPSLASNGYYYTGRRLDPETTGSTAQPSGLYYYRARMYSPTWGRFLQADPAGYSASPNLYAYTNNDPLDLVDPSGLSTLQIGGSGSINLPFGLTIPIGFGVALDTQGGIGLYRYAGFGGNAGANADAGVSIQVSNAKTINDLSGAFNNFSAHAGAGVGGSVDLFGGSSPNGPVVGGGVTLGLAAGASTSMAVTNTWVDPLFGAGTTTAANGVGAQCGPAINCVTVVANQYGTGTGTITQDTTGQLTGQIVPYPTNGIPSAESAEPAENSGK